MQKREARLTATHNEQLASLSQRLASLQSQQTQPSNPAHNTSTENELRSAIRALNVKLEKANAALSASRTAKDERGCEHGVGGAVRGGGGEQGAGVEDESEGAVSGTGEDGQAADVEVGEGEGAGVSV